MHAHAHKVTQLLAQPTKLCGDYSPITPQPFYEWIIIPPPEAIRSIFPMRKLQMLYVEMVVIIFTFIDN